MVMINFQSKGMDPKVTYRGFVPIGIEEKVLFLSENLKREVMEADGGKQKKKVKQLQSLLKASLSVLAVGISLAPKAFAAAGMVAPVASETITPALIMKWGLTLALISVSAGVALSMTMLSIAGIYRMFRKKDKATEWTQDIVKGLVQVLIAVPIVYTLYFLAQILFSHLTALKALF